MWLNPATGTPAAALETAALLDSFGPSLMPRTSLYAGVVGGVNVLAARAVAVALEAALRGAQPDADTLGGQLAARAVVAGVSTAASLLPRRDDERLWVAAVRSGGWLLRVAALGVRSMTSVPRRAAGTPRNGVCDRCWSPRCPSAVSHSGRRSGWSSVSS